MAVDSHKSCKQYVTVFGTVKFPRVGAPKPKKLLDDATAKEAVAIRKPITSHRTEVKSARLASLGNFDSVKSQFIDAEKDVLRAS